MKIKAKALMESPTQEFEDTAFNMGVKARKQNLKLTDNPFNVEKWLGRSWGAGWREQDMRYFWDELDGQ